MTGRVEWRCSAPAESVHFRTNTHSVGNMSCSRWTELQLIAFFKNWLQCLQAKTVLWKCYSGNSRWNAATTVSATLQTFLHQLNSLFPLSSLACASRANTTSGSGVSAPTPAYFGFVLPPAAWKSLTRQRALKRTNTARQTRWACRDTTKKTRTIFLGTPSLQRPSAGVLPSLLPNFLCSAASVHLFIGCWLRRRSNFRLHSMGTFLGTPC